MSKTICELKFEPLIKHEPKTLKNIIDSYKMRPMSERLVQELKNEIYYHIKTNDPGYPVRFDIEYTTGEVLTIVPIDLASRKYFENEMNKQ